MKTIEINTAQKVTIQYELASASNRLLSYVIDWLIVGGSLLIIWLLVISALNDWEGILYFLWLVIAPAIIFYAILVENLLDGQTLGKRALGIKVVKLNGDSPTAHDYFIRWLFRFLDIWLSFGGLGLMLINATPQSQRLGGMLSGTTVIRKNSLKAFTLKDILKISTRAEYEPQFPQIRQFSEQDMLFIKRVIEREGRYPNYAHQKAVIDLSNHVGDKLGLE
ncbi:MAG: RDD family protein, partial [Saprospiraceae bacterium]|nr:RDD family protein [Saprospiraceae bacterium]